MTREQLIRKRQAKKRNKNLILGAAAIAALILLVFVIRSIAGRVSSGSGSSGKEQTVAPVEESQTGADTQASVASDTVTTVALGASMNGKAGWNLNDTGWWYQPDDSTMVAGGWKTIEGQRYFFKEDGYMATGWINTGGGVRDTYFDECGRADYTKRQKLIALTYDDGPAESTTKVLDAMEKYNMRATFFVVGTQADYYRDILKREAELGMEIGNHTYDHPWLNQLDSEGIQEEISKNDDLIESITGQRTVVMRPTGGGLSETLINSVGKPMIQWDVDTLDWEHKDPDKTYERFTELIQEGSIILMHDLFSPAGDAADRMLAYMVENGYKSVTVSELAEAYGYDMEAGGQYYAFYPGGCDQNKTAQEGIEAGGKAAWDE